MGYIRHDTIIVTSWNSDHLKKAHLSAIAIVGAEVVSEIVGPLINGQESFFIAPDGSREGWKESNDYDLKRTKYTSWLKEKNYFVEWVYLSIGSDEKDDTEILESGYYIEKD